MATSPSRQRSLSASSRALGQRRLRSEAALGYREYAQPLARVVLDDPLDLLRSAASGRPHRRPRRSPCSAATAPRARPWRRPRARPRARPRWTSASARIEVELPPPSPLALGGSARRPAAPPRPASPARSGPRRPVGLRCRGGLVADGSAGRRAAGEARPGRHRSRRRASAAPSRSWSRASGSRSACRSCRCRSRLVEPSVSTALRRLTTAPRAPARALRPPTPA